jgi:hypothetical protein
MSTYRNTTVNSSYLRTCASFRAAMTYIPEDAELPALYATENTQGDPLVRIKLFDPTGSWTWYLLEWDGQHEAFGLVVG